METNYHGSNSNGFNIGGKAYNSLSEFLKSLKMKKMGKDSCIFARKSGLFRVSGYFVEYSEPFPCFDSSDYAYENRYRSVLYFTDSLEDAKKLYKDFEKGNKDKLKLSDYERLSFVRNDPEDKTFITYTRN